MKHFAKRAAIVAAVLSLAGLGATSSADDSPYSNKWRIECTGGAEGEGAIVFRVTPKEGSVSVVKVSVLQGRSENDVAHDIRDAFLAQLSPVRFESETDDGEDVLVKAKSGTPDFSLVLVSSTVEHVSLHLQRE